MKINYQDEYGEPMYSTNGDAIPSIGHSIMFRDEDYRVKNVTWLVEEG